MSSVSADNRFSQYVYRSLQEREPVMVEVFNYCNAHMLPFTAQLRASLASPINHYALMSPQRITCTDSLELLNSEARAVVDKYGAAHVIAVNLECSRLQEAMIPVSEPVRISFPSVAATIASVKTII